MTGAAEVDADLSLLREAAAEAGRIALGYFRQNPEVWWKEGDSPVSEADLAVDAYLNETLLAARPDYGWLSEETVPAAADAPTPDRFFVIDPIDGTRSFLRGEDTWCVSVAVVANGRPVAGVIDAPLREEIFCATAGGGATLNGRTLRLASAPPADGLAVAVPDGMRRRLDPTTRGTLRLQPSAPSLAYRLAPVAAGRLDGTLIRPNANDWDIAAGDLILAEAGGRLAEVTGELGLYKIAGRRHALLIAATRSAWPQLEALARSLAAPG